MGKIEKKATTPTVLEIFEKMDYGPAPESDAAAQKWLDSYKGKFGHFIGGKWVTPDGRETKECKAPSKNKVLATATQGTADDIDAAAKAASEAFAAWSKLTGYERGKHLYNLARHLDKQADIVAVVESLNTGKTIREVRAAVKIAVRNLDYYSGWAALSETEIKDWAPLGVIGTICSVNFPLMLLTSKIAPALAMGNTVVVKPSSSTCLSALFFAEVCSKADLPKGVFNLVTCKGSVAESLAKHSLVDKITFTGSTEVGKTIRKITAGTGKRLSLELGGKSPIIVYENADVDSAVEAVIEGIWSNGGQNCFAGSKLLVQGSIFEKFMEKLKGRLGHFRVGDALDKNADMGALVNDEQKNNLAKVLQDAKGAGAEIFQAKAPDGCFFPPTIITNVSTSSKVVTEEIMGPILVAMPFRTASEAVSLANNTMYGLAASVHAEAPSAALETARSIKAGTVWINAHNMIDAAASFGGSKQSGFGRDGGKEGLYDYIKPSWQPKLEIPDIKVDTATFAATYTGDNLRGILLAFRLFYGGGKRESTGDRWKLISNKKGEPVGEVPNANGKDVRNAVEVAVKALTRWGNAPGCDRAKVLIKIREGLQRQRQDFVGRLVAITEESKEICEKEFDMSIQRLSYWAAYADKYGGCVEETPLYGTVITVHEPVGVIGIACPSKYPLLGFISLFAPAIARSNCVIAVPSEECPIFVTTMYIMFEKSGAPPGVINILTGDRDHIARCLVEHQDVNGVWYFGSPEGSKMVEDCAAATIKRTWVNYGQVRNWILNNQGQGDEFLNHSTQVKTIWQSVGDIFSN